MSVLLIFSIWLFCLPSSLFEKPTSTVLLDNKGQLLGAKIAEDGQWRFPISDSIPEKFQKAIVAFEDKHFYRHIGFDPLALGRATWQNIRAGRVVSGGSTLTMQTIRLLSENPPRTFFEKIKEIFKATRLEAGRSKAEILNLYASNAPFGGNVVGLEAAVWRYFGKKSSDLSWAEAAALAVLPNSPALIHPGRNRGALKEKRDRLLEKLKENGEISENDCALAKLEPLPDAPVPLPQIAPHLLDRLMLEKGTGQRYTVTLDAALQVRCAELLENHGARLRGLGVHNMAAVVLDVPTNSVLAYIGNVGAGAEHGERVDVVDAPRSSGSILKPYLYALGMQEGSLLPNALMEDVPTQYGSYAPQNYRYTYDGAVSAKRALSRSLNVPWVRFLKEYGIERFQLQLQKLGFMTINRPSDDYGLSLILGGAEVKLFDVASAYGGMARTLGNFYARDGWYSAEDFEKPQFLAQPKNKKERALQKDASIFSAGTVWSVFESMREVERPNELGDWELFETAQPVAWKTGTSFGFRDAWAAGVTPRHVVAVWVGNADGEGRAGLIGAETAAPILFDLFQFLPKSVWFSQPFDDMRQVAVCKNSGLRANEFCQTDSVFIPKNCLRSAPCTFCTQLHLDPTGTYQVHSGCAPTASMLHRAWFVLPTVQEYFYKRKNPSYQSPPPLHPDCSGETANNSAMRMIYPQHRAEIFIPRELDGRLGKAVFEAAHRRPSATIQWYLDELFLGETHTLHQMGVQAETGSHLMVLVDEKGERISLDFEVVGK